MFDDRTFEGKHVLITGASRGIGNATLHAFAKRGAQVVACASRLSNVLEEDASKLRLSYGVDIQTRYFDLQDYEAVKREAHDIAMDHIDVLVNNAGISQPSSLLTTSLMSLRQTLEVNLLAPCALAYELANSMRGGGHHQREFY